MSITSGLGNNCCYYNACPEPVVPYDYLDAYGQCNFESGPTACCPDGHCPVRTIFDGSSFPVDTDGNIALVDIHGGAASDTWALLRLSTNYRAPGELIAEPTNIFVYFEYVRPGWYITPTGILEAPPGTIVKYSRLFDDLWLQFKVQTVQHVSADFPGASPGAIDSADLAQLASSFGKPSCYGLFSDPEGCGRWYHDLTFDGFIDSSDFSAWAGEAPTDPQCPSSSKASDDGNSTAAMLAWFGMEFTNDTVTVNGKELKKVEVVNPGKMELAIQNPYGWQTNISSVKSETWSHVKTLFQ